ncbi:MAG: sodium:proton exchanger [Acidobacteriota bacterium]|nr:sodium:proton exchanger [Acidobacteriota bacterium]
MSRLERALLALVLLFTALAGVGRYASGFPTVLAFVLAALALAGQAWTVSFATEQIGMRFGPAATGVLQSTIGNLPEFFVVLFALQAHEKTVAETALIGSILVNALLVLGAVLVTGAARERRGVMRFATGLPNDTATLMLVASLTIVLIALVTGSHDGAGHHVQAISIVGAAALLIVYAVWMRQYLRGDRAPGADAGAGAGGDAGGHVGGDAEKPRVSLRTAVVLLIAAGVGSAFVSDWFVHALEPTIHRVHLSQSFAGIVIVAIAGNAVENTAGIYLAYRGKHDLAISVVKNSVAQIAAFLYPLMVLVSLATATHLTFALAPVWVGALIGTAILIWQITGDGEATPFEGAALISVYVVLATVAAFEH